MTQDIVGAKAYRVRGVLQHSRLIERFFPFEYYSLFPAFDKSYVLESINDFDSEVSWDTMFCLPGWFVEKEHNFMIDNCEKTPYNTWQLMDTYSVDVVEIVADVLLNDKTGASELTVVTYPFKGSNPESIWKEYKKNKNKLEKGYILLVRYINKSGRRMEV